MKKKIKISLIQMDVQFARPETNYNRAVKLMEQALKDTPDILVFPETMNVGFFPAEDLRKLADVNGQKTKDVFGSFAKQNRVHIVAGSVANRKGEHIYNTLHVFNREGQLVCEYDKIHSFTPANEHQYFKGGNKVVTFELDGICCSAVICYDIRFPELVRAAALRGVELLFVPAQWPLARNHHWVTLAAARAIENQMFVCAVNACGYAGEIKYGGNSLLLNPWGEEICHLGTQEEIQTAEIDMACIQGIRQAINIFRDRKPECYLPNC